MLALGIGPGDEVVVPAFTWVTSAYSAEYVGARAVFADVRKETFNLDPEAFEAAIGPATAAVVVVHLFGQSAEMEALLTIARKYGLRVVEDAACAIGSSHADVPVGGMGDTGCFSFHPRKIVTTGEGGVVTTRSSELARRIRSLGNHGMRGTPGPPAKTARPYEMGEWEELGFNLRMSDLQAALGVVQMKKLDALLEERLRCARRYDAMLAEVPGLQAPEVAPNCGHTYQSYVIRVVDGARTRRNEIMEFLAAEGIQTRPGTHAVPRLAYFARRGIRPEAFPAACDAEDRSITLPLFPGMTEADQERVIGALVRAMESSGAGRG